MKTRFATTLSIVGVLGAGAVAMAANTSILAGDTDSPAAPSVITLPAAQTGAASATPPPSSNAVTNPTSNNALPTTPIPSVTTPNGERTTFNVGEAGALTVDSSDGRLSLVSAVAHDGWTPSEITVTPDSSSIAMNFVSSTTQVWVRIGLIDGQPVPEIASNYVPGAVIPPTEAAAVANNSSGSGPSGQPSAGSSNAVITPANPPAAAPAVGYEDDDDDDDDEGEGEDDD